MSCEPLSCYQNCAASSLAMYCNFARLLLITRLSVCHDRPNDPRGHYNLGVCLDALGEASSALGSFETAFGLQPDMADAGANAAGLCIRRGEAERACTLCYLVSYVCI